MSNKNFPKVKDVIDLQSSVLLELLLTRTLSKTDLATIKKNTSMLLGIVFATKDAEDEKQLDKQTGDLTIDQLMTSETSFSLIEETFSRESFAMLIEKVDVTRLTLDHFNAFYIAAKKNNQFINFVDLVLEYQNQTEHVWLTKCIFETLIKESIESPRLSFKDFDVLLNKLFLHFLAADSNVLDEIFNYAIFFGQLNHLDILLNFYQKVNDKLTKIKIPQDTLFAPIQQMKDHRDYAESLKENAENLAMISESSPNCVSGFDYI